VVVSCSILSVCRYALASNILFYYSGLKMSESLREKIKERILELLRESADEDPFDIAEITEELEQYRGTEIKLAIIDLVREDILEFTLNRKLKLTEEVDEYFDEDN